MMLHTFILTKNKNPTANKNGSNYELSFCFFLCLVLLSHFTNEQNIQIPISVTKQSNECEK